MKEILTFLKDLGKNNNREWFESNKKKYLVLKEQFSDLVKRLIGDISGFEPGMETLVPGDCIFRINRDIRFSKDKRPYKENFGAYFSEGGKKSTRAGYYLHIQPGNGSFAAGGMYIPTPDMLKKIRQEIDYNPQPLLSFMKSKNFRQYFHSLEGDKLKRIPPGYHEDHPNAELLKFKSYLVIRNFDDKEVKGDNFEKEIIRSFKAIKPLNDYLNAIFD